MSYSSAAARVDDVAAGFRAVEARFQGFERDRYFDIGFSVADSFDFVVKAPVTRPTEINPAYVLAEATGSGAVTMEQEGNLVGTITFPGADFDFATTSLVRGFLTFTPSGTLSDFTVALSGER